MFPDRGEQWMPGILCLAAVSNGKKNKKQPVLPKICSQSCPRFMSIIAFRPERATGNPPRDVSMDTALRGRVLRLEVPEELDGSDWDGPVYAVLSGDPKHLQPTDRSPFVLDDGERSPAWPCKLVVAQRNVDPASVPRALRAVMDDTVWVPYWRLTQPHRDLARELDERPLLTVFRFARISRYFMSSPGDDTKLILRTPGVHVCCQVLAYRAATTASLVDDIGVIIEPGSAFLCIVALRRHMVDDPVIVAVPLADIQASMIPAVEFMLGYAHGLAAAHSPAPFTRGWTSFTASERADPITTRARLNTCFQEADPVAGATIDLGTSAVPYVTPQGAIVNQVPVNFVLQATQLPLGGVESDDDMEVEAPATRAALGGPLLGREDVVLTPLMPAIAPRATVAQPSPASSTPVPAPAIVPRVTVASSLPASSTPVPAPTPAPALQPAAIPVPVPPPAATPAPEPAGGEPSARDQFYLAALQELRDDARHYRETTAQQFTLLSEQMTNFSTALTNMNQQLVNIRPQIQAQPVLQIQAPPVEQIQAQPVDPPALAAPTGPPPAQVPGTEHRPSRTGVAYDADRDDVRHPHARGRSRSRDRNRQRDRGRSHERERSRSATGHGRSRSPPPRAWRFGRQDRSRSRDRSPQGPRPTGQELFRPTANQIRVHENARVRPRTGTTHELEVYDASDPQDRIRRMLQFEILRRRYRPSKVTTKMLFSVDFGSRHLDHWLPDAGDFPPGRSRIIPTESTQWSSNELRSPNTIETTSDLRKVTHLIQDAASVWYPDDIARVFRAVECNATQCVPDGAPTSLIDAVLNLYTEVFSTLFTSLLRDGDHRQLERQATLMLDSDSAAYRRHVGRVMSDAMMLALLRGTGPAPHAPTQAHHRAPTQARHHAQTPPVERRRAPPGGRAVQQPVLPTNLRVQVPKLAGKEVCLRFQTIKDCDFPGCKREHSYAPLPRSVVDWLEAKHGSLKSDHPSST